jgi:hypothetical protein
MEEGLENLLNLLEGVGRRRGSQEPQDSPSDKLQYLSQLEMVARKLKHQLIQQTKVYISAFKSTTIEHAKFIRIQQKGDPINSHGMIM